MDNNIHAERPLLNRGPIIGAERVLSKNFLLKTVPSGQVTRPQPLSCQLQQQNTLKHLAIYSILCLIKAGQPNQAPPAPLYVQGLTATILPTIAVPSIGYVQALLRTENCSWGKIHLHQSLHEGRHTSGGSAHGADGGEEEENEEEEGMEL